MSERKLRVLIAKPGLGSSPANFFFTTRQNESPFCRAKKSMSH